MEPAGSTSKSDSSWPGELKYNLQNLHCELQHLLQMHQYKKAKQNPSPARTDSQMDKFVIVFMIFCNVFAGFHSLV